MDIKSLVKVVQEWYTQQTPTPIQKDDKIPLCEKPETMLKDFLSKKNFKELGGVSGASIELIQCNIKFGLNCGERPGVDIFNTITVVEFIKKTRQYQYRRLPLFTKNSFSNLNRLFECHGYEKAKW